MCLAHTLYRAGKIGVDDIKDYERLIVSTMRLQCKEERGREVKRLFIKLPVWCSPQVLKTVTATRTSVRSFKCLSV